MTTPKLYPVNTDEVKFYCSSDDGKTWVDFPMSEDWADFDPMPLDEMIDLQLLRYISMWLKVVVDGQETIIAGFAGQRYDPTTHAPNAQGRIILLPKSVK